MANSPQKSKDATEAALSAIQEALSIRQPDLRAPAPSGAAAGADSGHGQMPPPPGAADLFHAQTQEPAWPAEENSARRAANDDRADIGQILQTLRRRPARLPYLVASIAAVVWAAVGIATAFLYSAELQTAFATPRFGAAAVIVLVTAIVAPAIFFYVIAHMFTRSQDMRLVAETMAEVAMRLAQPESTAHESIVTVGQAVRREVAAMGDGVERALARAAELEALMHNEVSALERTYSENEMRIRNLLGELTNQRETLVSQVENVRNAISSVHLDLSHDIASVGDLVADKVNEVAQRTTRSLAEKGEHITLALANAGDSMIDALTERGSSLLERLETTSDNASNAIASASDRLANSLNFKTDHVHDEFAELATRLQQMMTTRLDQVTQGFAQKAALTIETMANRSQGFTAAIADRADDMDAALRSTGDQVAEMLVARLQAFDDMFKHGGTELSEKIGRDASTLGNLITRHIAEFDRTVKTYGGELVERLGTRTQDVSEAMRNYVDTFDQRVGSRTSELASSLDLRLSQFEEVLGARVSGLAQTLTEGGKDVVGALDRRIGEVTGTIDTRGAQLADTIGARVADIDRTLGARALEVANTLDSRIGRFEELLVGRATTVTEQIESRTRTAADTLNARMEQLSQSIKTNSEEAERSLSQLALNTTEAIRASATHAERSLTGMSDEIASVVSARTEAMAAVLSDKSSGVLSAITEKGIEFASEIGKATDLALSAIDAKGFAFTRTMLDNSGEISRLINSAGESAANSVTRTINDLNDTAQKVIAQSRDTTTATVNEMMETHNRLRSDTTSLFERLREANIMLQEVLSGSHENMSALENTLMLRVAEFVTAMNEVTGSTTEVTDRVERNISSFREITSHLVTDLGQLAGQFDAHGRDLAKAAELIDHSNQRTEGIVSERRVQLDSLVATLDIRTEDIEQRLKRFSGLLDESLEAASTRAREVARVVSESSAEGTRAINIQFERARDETQGLFSDANERFGEVVHDMKQMAAEMHRELEATRAEVRRGVFELPHETAEGAAQMRRVIVDQIEALAELNRIVARHGRNLDAVEPMRRQREEPTLAIVGGRSNLPPRGEQRMPPRNDPGSFAPAARRAEAPSLSPAQAGAGRGWLSELLTRASRAENAPAREFPREPAREPVRDSMRDLPRAPEDRPARHSIESLDSLSVDIARMIDHDAAADLWDRYKRGERNVFTRKLYTLQGQQAFDEIRKKYRGDPEFKLTVDRYIGEFERLLEEVSRDDRGQVVARTYLTSETGKVYTMLAHAAGRFD